MNSKTHSVTIYTDGSALGNPGKGGFGIVMLTKNRRKEIARGFRLTTNNRMELLSVIIALETLKVENCSVKLYTDSKYVTEAVEKRWVFTWEQKRFKNKKNQDLWMRFLRVYPKHSVKFIWIKGHAGHPENEHCDSLAKKAANATNLNIDDYYENMYQNQGKIF